MRTLVVLGTILAVISVLAIWVNRLVLDTNTWVDTSDELLKSSGSGRRRPGGAVRL